MEKECMTELVQFKTAEIAERIESAKKGIIKLYKENGYDDAVKTLEEHLSSLKNDKKITGYQIGTSLNSFGTNYSNIIKLNDYCSQSIFKTLLEDIVSE